jgi:hypothetical protein
MNFLDRSSKEWFVEAAVFALIAKVYDRQGMVANAGYFEHRAIYSLAQAILARWFESDKKLK